MVTLLCIVLEEEAYKNMATEAIIINAMVDLLSLCQLAEAINSSVHTERARIPSGRFNKNDLNQSHKVLFRFDEDGFNELYSNL